MTAPTRRAQRAAVAFLAAGVAVLAAANVMAEWTLFAAGVASMVGALTTLAVSATRGRRRPA